MSSSSIAFRAGRESNGNSLFDFASLPSGSSGSVIFAVLLALVAGAFLALVETSLGLTNHAPFQVA